MGRWFLWGLVWLLTACASGGPQGDLNLHEGPVRSWTLLGRVAIHRPQGSDSASLDWRIRGDQQRLELLSPLGSTVALLTSTPLETHLTLADRREYVATDPSALTQQVLGYAWPLEGLAWWLKGEQDPQLPAVIERDEQGHISRLSQSGWVIGYTSWRQVGAEWLPGMLVLTREEVRIRVKVDRWILGRND